MPFVEPLSVKRESGVRRVDTNTAVRAQSTRTEDRLTTDGQRTTMRTPPNVLTNANKDLDEWTYGPDPSRILWKLPGWRNNLLNGYHSTSLRDFLPFLCNE
jgi:hypothetical protein